ncbi:SpoIIE family protein phosphatase [Nocardia sp. CDC159]|uniref:histidine kinase n=1 Tax=Nocardia pulmonis TaxID=2951408 RepID=A0A9X2IZW3_9NOCA|nr:MULTISPECIES: SpoIIE family protein phosphatase [Nocardia]MCM6775391.1 SpoIIE family protein phosphatase [Nocardia pulmonis]MCM6787875.1 SpoIIE family protein phosphatase [Nocardia sp. CDC159]
MTDTPAAACFPGSGEMARRLRAHPWAETTVGPPATWPDALRSAVRIALPSRFPMLVWWGRELRLVYNDAYAPLLGGKHPALWQPGARVWGEIWHIVGPMLESVLATGEATWSEDLLLPMDRHGYREETYWTYSYSPLHDADGAVRGVFTAVSETTERVIGQRRLAVLQDLGAQAGKAHDVAEAAGLVAQVLTRSVPDVPFAAIHVRPSVAAPLELLACAPTDAGGKWCDARRWPVAEVVRTGRGLAVGDLTAEFGVLPDGGWQIAPTEAMVLPLAADAGAESIGAIVLGARAGRALDSAYRSFLELVARQSAGLINAAIAYRAQQRRAEELAELDRAKTAFFANISHEFRTPLTLIMGPIEELRAHWDVDDRVRTELDLIHRNGLRLAKLVNTLLDFSRIEAGRMQARYEPVELSALTADLASVFRSAIERAGLELAVTCPPLSRPVYVDRAMWEKVMLNLLSNAVKFTFEGRIGVAVREEADGPVVTVSDTGIGVPATEIPRLFERFHRITSARARSNEGSGIGLALVRELVRLHGGSITARSVEGAGTAFEIRLRFGSGHLPAENIVAPGIVAESPAGAEPYLQEALRWLPEQPESAGRLGDSLDPGATVRKPRVLIADDNADMREYLTRLLAPQYEVQAVTDGAQALAAATEQPPDLIVSDVMMPRLDGLALIARLRAAKRTAQIPILLLSARAGQEAAIEGLHAGADDYLVKPFSAAELLARARAAMAMSRLRTRHAAWRSAIIDALEAGFFVCDRHGTVLEINAAFTTILGYDDAGLPYPPEQPWWPDRNTDPEAYRQVREAFSRLLTDGRGTATIPVVHRDGHQVWVTLAFAGIEDPDSGDRLIVGTFRDVTAEHYAIRRETALSALGWRLARVTGLDDAIEGAVDELRTLWRARRVLAITFAPGGEPAVVSAQRPGAVPGDGVDRGHRRWRELPPSLREAADYVREQPLLLPVITHTGDSGIAIDHPAGRLVILIALDGRPFSEPDRTLLSVLGGHLAQGLRRAHQIDQQRETALALQHAILGPDRLPPGFAVRYEPATPPLEVGGDWYDVVNLPGGSIGFVVGDCVGRGLAAATVMGQMRSACQAMLLHTADPAVTLAALDRVAAELPGARCTSVFCAVLDPASGELCYSSAGHPPALLAHDDGVVSTLDGGHHPVLGIVDGTRRGNARTRLGDTTALLLYTDGLVERRGQSLDAGIAAAAGTLARHRALPVRALADSIMAGMAPAEGFTDDVALLVYRPVEPLRLEFPAVPDQLGTSRGSLRRWLTEHGIADDTIQDVLVSVGEACSNAIEHAYGAGSRTPSGAPVVTVSARIHGHTLSITIADHGRWRPPPPDNSRYRGRGMIMMKALMDEVRIRPTPTGTVVDMRTDLTS